MVRHVRLFLVFIEMSITSMACHRERMFTSAGCAAGSRGADSPDMQAASGGVAGTLQGRRLHGGVAGGRRLCAADSVAPRSADGCSRRGPPAALGAAAAIGTVLPPSGIARLHAAGTC